MIGETSSRRYERILLLPVVLAVWSAGALFYFEAPWRGGMPVIYASASLTVAFYAVHLLLMCTGHRGDVYLYPVACLLAAIGLIFVYRVQPALAARQYWWVLLGLAALAVVAQKGRDLSRLRDFQYLYVIIGIALLVVTVLIGTEAGGARSWLTMGTFRFEPAEGVKLLMVMFLASYLSGGREATLITGGSGRVFWVPLLLMGGLSLVLLVFQRDLGTAMIFFLTFLAMLYAVTDRSVFLLAGLGCLLVGLALGYFLFAHVRLRLEVWLDPWQAINAGGYQVTQAIFAFASGGIIGSGLGLGQPGAIPAAATDFVLAGIGAETGLAGAMGTILLYILFAYRGYRAAALAANPLESLLAVGLTSLVALHAIVITAGVTRLLPLTGITLPFVSYGGSSLVVNFILLALLLNISAHPRPVGGMPR